MRGCFHFWGKSISCSCKAFSLAVSLPIGFLCGMVFSWKTQVALAPLFEAIPNSSLDIGSFLFSLFFPFLLSAISVSAGFSIFLLFICFGKAFLSAIVLYGLHLSFQLPECLFILSFLGCSVSIILLYRFCRYCFCSNSATSLFRTLSFFLTLLAWGLVFYYYLMPTAVWL